MISKNDTITPLQTGLLIVQTQVGVGILSLPFSVRAVAKQDAWISTLIAGFMINVFIWFLILLSRRFSTQSLFLYAPQILGKWVGNSLSLIYIVYFILIGSLVLTLYLNVIYKWVFDETPIWATLLLMVLISVYLAKEPLRVIARFHSFVCILIVGLIGMLAYSYTSVDIRYIFPIGQSGFMNIIKGSKEAAISFLGYELLLVIYPCILKGNKSALKAATFANLFVTLFYGFVVFTALIIFSPIEIEIVPEPILYMLKAFSSRVVDRIDLFLLSIWMVCVTTSYVTYLYLGGKGIQSLFRIKKQSTAVFIAAFLTYWIPLFLQGELKISVFNKYMSNTSFAFTIGIPLLLLIISLIFHRKSKESRL